jgi:hypothetical protein
MAQQASNPAKSLAAVKDAVSCVDAGNALFFCASPAHQMERYYKDGHLDGCDAQLSELKLCMRLKLAGEKETRDIVRQLLDKAAAPPPTYGRVWSPRDGKARANSDPPQ